MRLAFALILFAACRPPGYGKGDSDPAPDTDAAVVGPGDDAAVESDGPASATCHKDFRLDQHSAAVSVWLTGSFIMWGADPQHGAVEFTLGVDGAWTGSHDFEAGQQQYKYIVDGNNWINDPTNADQVDDGFGGHNSVFTCAP